MLKQIGLGLLLVIGAVVADCTVGRAQDVVPLPDSAVRATVAREYSAHHETLYCVLAWHETADTLHLDRVKRVALGDSLSVPDVDCRGRPTLHTHPPGDAVPDKPDLYMAITRRLPFIVIVSDRTHYVVWPSTSLPRSSP